MAADPHNDQMAARCREDLREYLRAMEILLGKVAEEGDDDIMAIAVAAETMIENETLHVKDRLASVLAMLLVDTIRGKRYWPEAAEVADVE